MAGFWGQLLRILQHFENLKHYISDQIHLRDPNPLLSLKIFCVDLHLSLEWCWELETKIIIWGYSSLQVQKHTEDTNKDTRWNLKRCAFSTGLIQIWIERIVYKQAFGYNRSFFFGHTLDCCWEDDGTGSCTCYKFQCSTNNECAKCSRQSGRGWSSKYCRQYLK